MRRAAITLVLLAGGCSGRGRDQTARRAQEPVRNTATPATIVPRSPVPPRDSVSAHAVTWDVDGVVRRLTSAGIPATIVGPIRESFTDVPATLLRVPGAELEVFIYGDATAAAQDFDRFDTLTVSPRGTRLVWRKPPAILTDNNLVMIVLADDPAVRARVKSVFNLNDGPHPPDAGVPDSTP